MLEITDERMRVVIFLLASTGMTIEAMCELAIQENGQVANYLGYIWKIEQNHKLRQVVDSLLNHLHIKKVGIHPIVLQWLADTSESTDIKNKNKNQSNCQNQDDYKSKTMSAMSAMSVSADQENASDNIAAPMAAPIICAQNMSNYAKSLLINSILPRTVTTTELKEWSQEEIKTLANTRIKCPTCDYETEPFFMKIHQCPNEPNSKPKFIWDM
jgi:hypothetical protein